MYSYFLIYNKNRCCINQCAKLQDDCSLLMVFTKRPRDQSPHVRQSGIRNPANFCCWNPESRELDSGIHNGLESGIHYGMDSGIQKVGIRKVGIRNPGPSWMLLHGDQTEQTTTGKEDDESDDGQTKHDTVCNQSLEIQMTKTWRPCWMN